jgi:sorbitol-specific phosphotransferase system component IIBC
MMILTFLYALAVAAVLGLPADYTWRRARQLAPLAGLASAAAIIAAIYLAARISLLHGPGAVAALVIGLIAGGISADALASRRWGPAHHQY